MRNDAKRRARARQLPLWVPEMSSMPLPAERNAGRELALRVALLGFLAATLLTLLLGRMWYLQVIKGSDYRIQSESNRVRLSRVVAPRGLIYDRAGRLLADNRPAYDIA
ncbi:MAG: hypothetical protein KC466_09500, partial [Myxococcales bacterium]|nr:hypothetical protein [Myxococcales bacterium]